MRSSATHDSAPPARKHPARVSMLAAAILLALAVFSFGCGDDAGGGETGTGVDDTTVAETTAVTEAPTTSTESPPPSDADLVECTEVPEEDEAEPCPTEIDTAPADVEVSTSEGDFTISLAVDESPATTTSFRQLAESGFYDGLTFSRVVPGYVVQGGDPLFADPALAGTGGPGYFVDEEVPDDVVYTRGVVAMAKTGDEPAGRSGSQFFVVSGDDAELPTDYAFVGKVTNGLDTVAAIEALGVSDGPPRREVTIDSMTVVNGK